MAFILKGENMHSHKAICKYIESSGIREVSQKLKYCAKDLSDNYSVEFINEVIRELNDETIGDLLIRYIIDGYSKS